MKKQTAISTLLISALFADGAVSKAKRLYFSQSIFLQYAWLSRANLNCPIRAGALFLACFVCSIAWADAVKVLRIDPVATPPVIDLSEILNDPKETRQRLGWMAALRVGTTVGMHYLNSQSIQSQCSGNLCGVLGMDAIESIQLGLLEAQTIDAMTDVLQTTIAESSTAGSTTQAQALADALQSEAGDATIQSELAALAEKFLLRTATFEFDQPSHEEETSGSKATHVLEISIGEIRTDGNFVNSGLAIELVGTARVMELATGETVETYTHVEKTPSYKQVDWSVGGAGVMARELIVAMARLTEVLTEEVLMVVNSPSGKGKGYLLQPLNPKSKVCFMGCKGKMWGNFGFQSEVSSLTPTIVWESFEERYAEDPLDSDLPALDAVSYDLRLFEAVPITRLMGDRIYGAGPMLVEYRGIEGNQLTLEQPLPPCTRLLWTVRARFEVQGERFLSRWSGHYSEKKVERMRQAEVDDHGKFNDGLTAIFGGADYSSQRQESAWYYAFRTPPPEDQKRCRW